MELNSAKFDTFNFGNIKIFFLTEKTCFTMQDLETATLGKVGDTVEAVLLHTENVGVTYFMCPMDLEMARYVEDILPGQVCLA